MEEGDEEAIHPFRRVKKRLTNFSNLSSNVTVFVRIQKPKEGEWKRFAVKSKEIKNKANLPREISLL